MDYDEPQSGLGSHILVANKEHGTWSNYAAISLLVMFAPWIDMNDALGMNGN